MCEFYHAKNLENKYKINHTLLIAMSMTIEKRAKFGTSSYLSKYISIDD